MGGGGVQHRRLRTPLARMFNSNSDAKTRLLTTSHQPQAGHKRTGTSINDEDLSPDDALANPSGSHRARALSMPITTTERSSANPPGQITKDLIAQEQRKESGAEEAPLNDNVGTPPEGLSTGDESESSQQEIG